MVFILKHNLSISIIMSSKLITVNAYKTKTLLWNHSYSWGSMFADCFFFWFSGNWFVAVQRKTLHYFANDFMVCLFFKFVDLCSPQNSRISMPINNSDSRVSLQLEQIILFEIFNFNTVNWNSCHPTSI